MSLIERNGSIISVPHLTGADLPFLLAHIHKATDVERYKDIVLDFTECTVAWPMPMLALCSQIISLQNNKIDFELFLPKRNQLKALFANTGWANIISPHLHDPSKFQNYLHIPVTRFDTPEEQYKIVNKIIDLILGAIPDFTREDFAAFEWSINELTDNVLTHSSSKIGGLVQVTVYQEKKRVEFVVADAGLSIPVTLRNSKYLKLNSDVDALDQAIREGVTRDTNIGQGNGLFGSFQICSKSGGFFQIYSNYARLYYDPKKGLSINKETIPYKGTLIAASVDFSQPNLLGNALKFAGKKYVPVDYIETHLELEGKEDFVFRLTEHATSFGARTAGKPIKNKITNLLDMCPRQKIIVDFSDIALISSSFADEILGKLFIEMGPTAFNQRIIIANTSNTVRELIDRAILQRSRL